MSPTPASSPATEWLSLGPASRLLGVDPDTLRRWADAGRVEAFATPGGHRRFQRRSLERLIASGTVRKRPLRFGASADRFAAAYRRGYEVPRHGDPDIHTIVRPMDQPAYRDDGRRLVAALLQHLDERDGPGGRRVASSAGSRAEQQAVGLAADMGRRLAAGGTGLTEAIAVFAAARRPFLAELGSISRRRAFTAAALSALYDEASRLLDRLLIAFVEGFQSPSGGSR